MANPALTIEPDLEAVTAALAGVQPRPGRVLLFGSRARGDARPDSDFDLLVVMPPGQAHPVGTATGVAFAAGGAAPPAVVGGRRACRGGRRGCPASGWLPLACGGAGPARGEGAACRRLRTRCCCCGWLSGIWAASGEPWIPGRLRRKTGVFWRNRPWRSGSRLRWCFTARNRPAAIRCNVCCRRLARYDAEPAPLPVERRLLLEQLEALHAEEWQRLS